MDEIDIDLSQQEELLLFKVKQVIIFILVVIGFLFCTKNVFASTIKINEFYSAGSTSSNPDWVEVYYNGVDITLYQLKDATGNIKNLSEGSYDGNFATVDWSNRLNNDGDTIKLVLILNPDSPIDQVTYGESGDVSTPNAGQSAGRNPDGTSNWTIFSIPSKGFTNNNSPITSPTPTPTPSPTPSLTPSHTPAPTPTSTKTPSPSPTPKKTSTPTPTPTPTPSPTSTPIQSGSTPSSKITPSPTINRIIRIASVAAVAASSSSSPQTKVEVKNKKQNNPIIWTGIIFIIAGAISIGYIYLKQNEKLHFPFRR